MSSSSDYLDVRAIITIPSPAHQSRHRSPIVGLRIHWENSAHGSTPEVRRWVLHLFFFFFFTFFFTFVVGSHVFTINMRLEAFII
jgi:hypothetical protein